MEEVDGIILHTLRQIGCDIHEDINSLKQLSSDNTVMTAVSCLDLIQPGLGLPKTLPHNMAAKFRVAQDIAQACTEIGYPSDIGYQTFLYPGESDLRKVLMFLIEKLPKEQEKFVQELSGLDVFLKEIRLKVKNEMSKPWLPGSYSNYISTYSFLSQGFIYESPALNWKKFWSQDLPLNTIKGKNLYPTIITMHSRCILAEREPHWHQIKQKEKIYDTSPIAESLSEVETFSNRNLDVPKLQDPIQSEGSTVDEERLKEKDEALTAEVEQLLCDIRKLERKKNQIVRDISLEQDLLSEKKMKDSVRSRVLEQLTDGENNVVKLERIVESATQRLVAFSAQWEKHRLPLLEEYRKIIQTYSSKENEAAKRTEKMKSMQEKYRELTSELKIKDSILHELETQSGKISKDIKRSAYTMRITEIIGNIKKQKTEIEKILNDTREVQKEINNLSGQLNTSFTIADETIFRDAKKDETSLRAYKLLATLHSDCDQLVETVQETGAIVREIRDLEDQIDKEKRKNITANLERITADLNQMKAESAQLAAKLNRRRVSGLKNV